MILLDTDHVSVLQWEDQAAERLRERLIASNDEWIGVTVVTLEEQCRATISRLGQCKKAADQPKYYARLASMIRFFGRWKIANFDELAASQFEILRKASRVVGRSDLRIASIAIVNDALRIIAAICDSHLE